MKNWLIGTGIAAVAATAYFIVKGKPKVENRVGWYDVEGWGYRNPHGIVDICIHHTATPQSWSIQDIADIHIGKWNKGISYTYFIDTDTIYQLNRIDALTYHNGVDNTHSLAIAMLGDFEKYPPTNTQIKLLNWLINDIKKGGQDFRLKGIEYLMGHNEFKATACPGKYVDMDKLRAFHGMDKRTFEQYALKTTPLVPSKSTLPVNGGLLFETTKSGIGGTYEITDKEDN